MYIIDVQDEKEAAPVEETVSVDDATDAFITSTRTGKVINSYEAVYKDLSVQEALKSGNDTEARSYIKAKLCNLGLAKEVCHIKSLSVIYCWQRVDKFLTEEIQLAINLSRFIFISSVLSY